MITFSRTNQNTLPLNELYNQTALHTTHKIDMVKRLSWQVTISKKRLEFYQKSSATQPRYL
jgi:hypothetical protein